jgi:hypothetical protein
MFNNSRVFRQHRAWRQLGRQQGVFRLSGKSLDFELPPETKRRSSSADTVRAWPPPTTGSTSSLPRLGERSPRSITASGFRANRKTLAKKVKPGDRFLCYLTGKSRFVGVFDVLSESYWDETPIWKSDPFPVRFKTRLVVKVPEDRGVHLHEVTAQSAKARS